jgi:hypothetical protein
MLHQKGHDQVFTTGTGIHIYIYMYIYIHIYIPPIPNHISLVIRSRDEEETEDALHEAGEGVVRVGRSWEGDLPHADG